MDSVIKLLAEEIVKDVYGVQKTRFTGREVFCKVESVTRSEFFNAGRNGLNPQKVFVVFKGDYDGERAVRHEGKLYAIYRTYTTDDDYMELYAERQGGLNGKEDQTGSI